MKVALIQYDIEWENPAANREKIAGLLNEADEEIDLVVLPEMFTTGFSMNTATISEPMDGPSIVWMKEQAVVLGCVVTGSIIVQEEGAYYNRLLWVRPDGTLDCYDKKHLFTLAKEHNHFKAGSERKIFELKADGKVWRMCPLICYDLRFPVWSRNTENYDLLIYVANFPEKRKFAWSQLLIARAIENQCYTIGVNRIGIDGVGIPYSGDSVAVDFTGQHITRAASSEGVFYANFSKEKLVTFRRAYNFLRDMDKG